MRTPNKTLSRVNAIILWLIILINASVIIMPFWPQIAFWLGRHNGETARMHQEIQQLKNNPPKDEANRLIIPAMQLDQHVLEGRNVYKLLDQGVLHWADSSTPDKGGNTVMLAHRFTYTNPKGAFYFLDKVQEGDEIAVAWGKKTYTYHVTETKTVPPTATEILDQTEEPTLTLYTCTPLWLPKDRLVVVAKLDTPNDDQANTPAGSQDETKPPDVPADKQKEEPQP